MPGPRLRRYIRLETTDPVFDVIYAMAAQQYPGASTGPAAIAREILLAGLGSDLASITRSQARRAAYLDTLVFMKTRLGRAMKEIGQTLEQDGVTFEALAAAEKATVNSDLTPPEGLDHA